MFFVDMKPTFPSETPIQPWFSAIRLLRHGYTSPHAARGPEGAQAAHHANRTPACTQKARNPSPAGQYA